MKVIVTGGGTGGHINPAIAIAQKIRDVLPETEILYVGTAKGMESELAPRSGFRFEAISVKGFRRKLSLDTFRTAGVLMKGLVQANALLRREKPDIVIGTGGYVCGPLVAMASMRRCRTLIHEQNAIPGATNKILSRFVNTVCISYEDSKKVFSGAKRVTLTGNPVRSEFSHLDREECRKRLGIPTDAFLVVSTGGSGGAAALNRAVKNVFQNYMSEGLYWAHITGKNYYTEFVKDVSAAPGTWPCRAMAFCHDMPLLMGAADLMVSRAGALIIAEMATAGIPSILVPSPNVANRHQDYNGEICRKGGMSQIIWEQDLDGEALWSSVAILKNDTETLAAMKKAALHMSMETAADRIFEEIRHLMPASGLEGRV